jgi:outer membrane protein assembly factor BamB
MQAARIEEKQKGDVMMSARTRTRRISTTIIVVLALVVCAAVSGAEGVSSSERGQAWEVLDGSDVKGGLIVHIGCGDGRLTAALRANERYIVHGLDADARKVQKAREYIRSLNIYGEISVEKLRSNRLPYIDNLVNLIVSEELGQVSMDEVMRVLCPNGVAYIKKGGKWTKTIKPRPKDIDEWTHYLHDATNNAVSHDMVVGPPGHLQWVGSPKWSRHHDRMAGMSALVSTNGRIFYIFDEGSTAIIQLPQKRTLIARDAFNGTILWKRSISSWHTHLWPFKSGPAHLPRRLVAVGDRVYVTLGFQAPLTALDAASGQTVRTYKDTDATEEVISSDGVLFLQVNDAPMNYNEYSPATNNIGQAKSRVEKEWPWDERPRRLMAVRADTGDTLWSRDYRIVPLTLAADENAVYFHDGEKILRLNRKNGEQMWASEPISRLSAIPTKFGPTLVVYDDVVLFAGGDRSMSALSANSGKILWTTEHLRGGHNSPEDLLVVGGLAWSGAIAGGRDSGIFAGRDLHTGEIKKEFPPDVETYWFHHRCYRAKATDRWLLPSRTGIEFVDFETKEWTTHHWVRGGCLYGIMPCNGLVYAPLHSCACYLDAKLYGFNALAPKSRTRSFARGTSGANRHERGPAYGRIAYRKPKIQSGNDWPTYRADGERSGFTKGQVPIKLKQAWETQLGGRLSSVVVYGNKVFVASIDTHTIYSLDAKNGEILWSFTAGGRVDSPPTLYQGRVLFGSADGWVYCLRAAEGVLVWRFRAAPVEQRLMSFEQLESVWPVHGSVLVQDGAVYCVAGRSMFLDGGMRLLRLDPKTGQKISETILDDRDPETGENLQVHVKGLNMPAALSDILSSEGEYVYMRTQRFDLNGVRRHIAQTDVKDQLGEGRHLFCSTGMLDGSWFHRSYWIFGKSIASGAGGWPRAGRATPAGRLLVLDGSKVYGYGRKPEYYKWTTPMEYHLFAAAKELQRVKPPAPKKPAKTKAARQRQQKRRANALNAKPVYHWSREAPIYVRAMVLADKTLFIAGPPDIIDEEEIFENPGAPGVAKKLGEQSAALDGQKGAFLHVVSASDGRKLAEYRLETVPVWDGMAASNGRLYLSMKDGRVLCMAGK